MQIKSDDGFQKFLLTDENVYRFFPCIKFLAIKREQFGGRQDRHDLQLALKKPDHDFSSLRNEDPGSPVLSTLTQSTIGMECRSVQRRYFVYFDHGNGF